MPQDNKKIRIYIEKNLSFTLAKNKVKLKYKNERQSSLFELVFGLN